MKARIYSLLGEKVGEVELPSQFSTPVRAEVIARAVISMQKNRIQPHGSDPRAGKRSSAKYMGTRDGWGHSYNYGQSRIPRLMLSGGRRVGQAKIVPQAVGGREAHPPQARENCREKINKKERLLAIRSAIAATALRDVVKARGHNVEGVIDFPLIVEDSFEDKKKISEVEEVFRKLGLWQDISRASVRQLRPGRGKMRGRKYKSRKGPLVVVSDDKIVGRAVRNLPGVDFTTVDRLNAELLAPGAKPGRLTLWTRRAVEKLSKDKLYGGVRA